MLTKQHLIHSICHWVLKKSYFDGPPKMDPSLSSDLAGLPHGMWPDQLESTFCRNFTCCGLELSDLHDLLQHYEEHHVRLDDLEVDDASLPGMVNDDGGSERSSNQSNPSSPATAAVAAATAQQPHTHPALPGSRPLSANAAALAAVNQRKRAMNAFHVPPATGPAGVQGTVSLFPPTMKHLSPRQSGSPFASSHLPISSGTDPEADVHNGDPLLGGQSTTSALGGLTLRSQGSEDHGLPSCAPPNLFFHANGSATAQVAQAGLPTSPVGLLTRSPSVEGAKADMKSAAVAPGTMDKPFKCPSPGCDKAYKQMNGLKYHRVHGHCNQNLLGTGSASGALSLSQQQAPGTTPATSPSLTAPPPGGTGKASTPARSSPAFGSTSLAAPVTTTTPTKVMATSTSSGFPSLSAQTALEASGLGPKPSNAATSSPPIALPSMGSMPGVQDQCLPSAAFPGRTPAPSPAPSTVSPSQVQVHAQAKNPRHDSPKAPSTLPPATPGSSGDASFPFGPGTAPAPGEAGGPTSGLPSAPLPPGHSGMPLDPRMLYMCQVGTCGKTYKNLNGLRYHYLHSGSHGLLGLQVLHTYGGGGSAKLGTDGRAVVSTATMPSEQVARAARLAAEMQAKKAHVTQRTVEAIQAQALAGGGPGHNHKQAQQMQAIVDADTAPQFDAVMDMEE